jgi:transcriptional regulator with XRE-family HTH domain
MSQEELADEAGIDRRTLQNIESGQGNPTLGKLVLLAQALGVDLPLLFREASNISNAKEDTQGNVQIEVRSDQEGVNPVYVSIENLSKDLYDEIILEIEDIIKNSKAKKSARVAQALVHATKKVPDANPSDVWHHVIYRTLTQELEWSPQSWKRTSGWALEIALCEIYEEKLKAYDIRMSIKRKLEANEILDSTGLSSLTGVGDTKIDLFIEGFFENNWHAFGVAHVKASIAERVVDDIPASKSIIDAGWVSILLTMDMKSYPPPHGDGVNYGELGGRTGDLATLNSIKRGYVEEDGAFSALFSFNSRTPASDVKTTSGNKIYTLGFWDDQPDDLVLFLAGEWEKIKDELK